MAPKVGAAPTESAEDEEEGPEGLVTTAERGVVDDSALITASFSAVALIEMVLRRMVPICFGMLPIIGAGVLELELLLEGETGDESGPLEALEEGAVLGTVCCGAGAAAEALRMLKRRLLEEAALRVA